VLQFFNVGDIGRKSSGGIMLRSRENGGYLADIAVFLIIIGKGASARDHSYAQTTAMLKEIEYFYKSDLAGICNVGCAAGAGIDVADINYTHALGEIKLCSVFKRGELIGCGKSGGDGEISENRLVGNALDLVELLASQRRGNIKRYLSAREVKSYVIEPVKTVDYSAENMLGRVHLHLLKSLVKVKCAAYFTERHRRVGEVVHNATALADVKHASIGYIAVIGTLSALLGKEGCSVEDYSVAAVGRVAGKNGCDKVSDICVFVIKFSCHFINSYI
jgi:hypothetical protein